MIFLKQYRGKYSSDTAQKIGFFIKVSLEKY